MTNFPLTNGFQILLEYTWKIPPIGKGQSIKGHLAWANGDTTGKLTRAQVSRTLPPDSTIRSAGYGMHADFTNGSVIDANIDTRPQSAHVHCHSHSRWDVDILQKALNDSRCVTINRSMYVQIEYPSYISTAKSGSKLARPFTQCATFAGLFNATKAKACTPNRGILTEPTGNQDEVEIPRLPGCNPLCEPFRIIRKITQS